MEKQLLAVLLKPLAVVFGQKRRGVGAECQLVDEDDHLLPVLERLLHKVKGKFQRVAGGGDRFLAALHLGVERAAHRVKRLVGVQTVVKAAAPRGQQRQRAGAGRGLVGQQRPGGLVGLQLGAVGVAPLGKQVGRVGVGLLGQRPFEAAQLLVAGIRHRTRGAGVGKAGVQARQQQADQTDALVKARVHRPCNDGVIGLALQNILDAVILVVLAVEHPVGRKIPRDLGVAQVLPDDPLVHGQRQPVRGL